MIKIVFFKNLTWKAGCLLLFLDFLKITFVPNGNLMMWGALCITMDLITGITKSLVKGEFLVSEGLRKTVKKLFQYIGVILLLIILSNVLAYNPEVVKRSLSFFGDDKMYDKIKVFIIYINNLILLMIIYTESLSIAENLVAIDPNSAFSKWVLKPLHYILSLAVIGNPLKSIVKNYKEKNNNTKPH